MITIKNIMINPNLVVYVETIDKDLQNGWYNFEVHLVSGETLIIRTKDKAELESWKALFKG